MGLSRGASQCFLDAAAWRSDVASYVPPLAGTWVAAFREARGEEEASIMSEQSSSELTSESAANQDGGSALKGEELRKHFGKLEYGWTMPNEHHLEKEYRFKDFRGALDFVNRLGEVAEQEGHHPDIFLTWGRVKVTLWTHSVGGLTEKDFTLAAKADQAK
jgi:4a-hydroxytetrahydrobiopterin dehydratase